MNFRSDESFALQLDKEDQLSSYRERFYIPQHKGEDTVYFTGNSLGLQPRSAASALEQELQDWQNLGVEGHFHGKNPWFHYHKFLTPKAAKLVGSKESEVVIMNNLTVNLHLMMVSFYRPTSDRFKIIMEGGAFPSDQYAMETQVKFHGFDPKQAIVEVFPRKDEYHLRTEDILETIKEHGDSVALVMFSGVQYYTGQMFNIHEITKAAHSIGALAGFDLAHAAGNIKLDLHNDNVDFAVWCSYKYLNSGPGGVSGVFVHERHGNNPDLPRFAGWWGHDENTRFLMKKGFIPEKGAAGWQISNAPVLTMAVHNASLSIFDEVGMDKIVEKGRLLNQFVEFHIRDAAVRNRKLKFEIITPEERGCQLSILAGRNGKDLFDYLMANGVIVDWREPNVIRLAPVPLYNSFMDVYRFGQLLREY